ncbi:MAG: serine--tRNA ligase, partial [Clostridia bacterium]|nr:serine--tRNA ligase [Clostridia bacterium]
MIDIKYIKENPEEVIARYTIKGKDAREEITKILELDAQRRALIVEGESLKAEQNKTNKLIPQYKKEGRDVAPIFAELKEIANKTKAIDEQLRAVEGEYNTLMLGLPNLPDRDLKPGGKENNEPLRYWGEPRKFDFEAKNHVDLCTELGLIDYKRGTKLSGSGFWIYRGMGARLEWALLNYFIDTHLGDGYELILPPHMLEYECGVTAGQFPKFADEVFKIANPTDNRSLYMLPTAEAALASLYRGELLTEADLPKKLVSYTPCFRREAGSYRSDER